MSADMDGKPLLQVQANEAESRSGMKSRTFTDGFCLVVFGLFLCGCGVILDYSFQHGDVRRLSHGFNYRGRLCGVDPTVENKKYLFYCPAVEALPGTTTPLSLDLLHPICVHECPASSSQSYLCYKGARVTETAPEPPNGDYTKLVKYDFTRKDGYSSYSFMNRYCVPDDDRLASQVMAMIGDGKVAQLMMKIGTLRSGYPALAASAGTVLVAFSLSRFSLPFGAVYGVVVGFCNAVYP